MRSSVKVPRPEAAASSSQNHRGSVCRAASAGEGMERPALTGTETVSQARVGSLGCRHHSPRLRKHVTGKEEGDNTRHCCCRAQLHWNVALPFARGRLLAALRFTVPCAEKSTA